MMVNQVRERPPEEQAITFSSTQIQQIRDLARSCGADPEFLLRALRETRVERRDGHVGLSSSLPASTAGQMRALDLSHNILRNAYEGPQGLRARPEFSPATLGAAGYEYVRHAHTFGPETTVISEKTTLWLERQARRFGFQMGPLRDAIVAYSSLIDANPDLAREALRHGCDGDRRLEAFVLAFSANASTRQPAEGGNTELFIRTVDTHTMLAEYRRETGEGVLGSRPRRVA